MNPWLIGGGLAALIAILAGSSSSSASTDQMVFRDYQWTTTLPSTGTFASVPAGSVESTLIQMAGQHQWPTPNPLAANLPPPPGCTSSSGRWAFYPNGWDKDYGTGVVVKAYPGVPVGVDVYAWVPSFSWSPNSPNAVPVTIVNGYTVTMAPSMIVHHRHGARWVASAGYPPAPPSVGGGPGGWRMIKPGYLVWVTPSNQNTAELATSSFNLGTTPTTLPAPSAQPIAVTG